MKNHFRVSISTHDETGEVIAVYFQIRKGKAASVREYADGAAFANYNRNGGLLGIEMLAPCSLSVLDQIAQELPERQFIHRVAPHGMVMAG